MADPAWQELIRIRLTERNVNEASFSAIIEQYRRLAQQTKLLKERNSSLLRAVSSVKSNPSSSTLYVAGTGEDNNPVRAAYITSLESQISSMRDELAGVYKTQGQNTQRLLAMTETLREKEELSRVDAEALRKSRDELMILRRKVEQHNELMTEKDRTVQILHDEISTLQLELGQIEERNATLTKDNAKLLQRWLDAKQSEANKMNEANEFYEDMRSKHQAVLNWRDGSAAGDTTASSNTGGHGSVSGNGEARDPDLSAETKDGILSTTQKRVDQTQNG
ncbi:ATG16-domain-containing protein [Lentinula raphanica]|nr:ATG16-domain-containing protein [Lentinula raphanica]